MEKERNISPNNCERLVEDFIFFTRIVIDWIKELEMASDSIRYNLVDFVKSAEDKIWQYVCNNKDVEYYKEYGIFNGLIKIDFAIGKAWEAEEVCENARIYSCSKTDLGIISINPFDFEEKLEASIIKRFGRSNIYQCKKNIGEAIENEEENIGKFRRDFIELLKEERCIDEFAKSCIVEIKKRRNSYLYETYTPQLKQNLKELVAIHTKLGISDPCYSYIAPILASLLNNSRKIQDSMYPSVFSTKKKAIILYKILEDQLKAPNYSSREKIYALIAKIINSTESTVKTFVLEYDSKDNSTSSRHKNKIKTDFKETKTYKMYEEVESLLKSLLES